ncbi:hypothetical protein [Comamonas guangdongensis]|uniref:Uncharacterized protein n=1 Tax=Comamonas guangdongensis TaxID=510515 RepID=A0ABV3ZS05_9BURK
MGEAAKAGSPIFAAAPSALGGAGALLSTALVNTRQKPLLLVLIRHSCQLITYSKWKMRIKIN